MAGAPSLASMVACAICGATFTKYQTLVWHRMRRHQTTRRQAGGGLPTGAAAASGAAGGSGHDRPPPPQRHQPPPPPPPRPPPLPRGQTRGVGEDGGDEDDVPDGDAGPRAPSSTRRHAAAGSDSPGTTAAADARAQTPQGGSTSAFTFDENAVSAAIEAMNAVIKLTRRSKTPDGRARKRLRTAAGAALASIVRWDYSCLSHDIREHYEQMKDWDTHVPLVTKRKACHPGRFNSYRLRMLQRSALECGGGGMLLQDQEKFFDVLDAWDRTKTEMPVDDGHFLGMRDVFDSSTDFKNALADDIDDVIEDDGWLKCTMVEGGESFKVIFRPALELAL
eukprot:TRINITY_DN994_c0_g1_i4.p1 TRINITY_DN994_c0_g1~~TRINITY_DN994_c0_g1_i4.p1  ORF type:complete len:336 (-),score=77.32 TRINITY_DN994_c0_g1_i4:455-1462(-)